MAPGRTQQLLLYAASLRKPRRERKKCKQPSAGKGEWFALRWFRLGSVSFFLAVHETWCDWWGPIIAPTRTCGTWWLTWFQTWFLLFANISYHLMADPDIDLNGSRTLTWDWQPNGCVNRANVFSSHIHHLPKKNIYPNEHSRVSNIGVVARAVRVCMRNPNNGPHIGNQSVYDLKNKSTWGQICVIVYSCLYIYIYNVFTDVGLDFFGWSPPTLKHVFLTFYLAYFLHISDILFDHAVAQGAFLWRCSMFKQHPVSFDATLSVKNAFHWAKSHKV